MRALLIIDMQRGMLQNDTPPHNLDDVVNQINRIAERMRGSGWPVVLIQHCGPPGDDFAQGEPGWQFLPTLEREDGDPVVSKSTCDAFYQTELEAVLKQHGVDQLLVCGWATDFCVDTTIRAAASREYDITVVADAHTAIDRSHLDAATIIDHHNRIWADLLVPHQPIKIQPTDELLRQL